MKNRYPIRWAALIVGVIGAMVSGGVIAATVGDMLTTLVMAILPLLAAAGIPALAEPKTTPWPIRADRLGTPSDQD